MSYLTMAVGPPSAHVAMRACIGGSDVPPYGPRCGRTFSDFVPFFRDGAVLLLRSGRHLRRASWLLDLAAKHAGPAQVVVVLEFQEHLLL